MSRFCGSIMIDLHGYEAITRQDQSCWHNQKESAVFLQMHSGKS